MIAQPGRGGAGGQTATTAGPKAAAPTPTWEQAAAALARTAWGKRLSAESGPPSMWRPASEGEPATATA